MFLPSTMADPALAPDAGQCEPATASDGPDVNHITPAADLGDPADLLPLLEKVSGYFRALQKSVGRARPRRSSLTQPGPLELVRQASPRRD